MLSTCKGVAADPGRGGAEPGAETPSSGLRGSLSGEEKRQGPGVQEWSDGSRYEGEFVNGLKHGRGKYTWSNGEYYEGSFYKDYRHGDGLYCWPTGHKFTGKFYLNRKEGYGQQLFPDGTTFQGLHHADQRFGPGVITYPDGREDVGLWLGKRLLKLCASVDEGFSLKNFPEYAAYIDPTNITEPLTQPPNSDLQTDTRTDCKVALDRDPLSDDDFILPPGIESYSTNGDHLPLPLGRRRELDRHFFGELWEPDVYPHPGYERDPLSKLPLQARMQAHIDKHRIQAENAGWDVAAVLSLNRERFGPKGPLEVSSELLIHHASRGELQAVSQILQTGSVHPDVADSQGHTALIAATVNCRNDVIQLLLDMGSDIDKLNCEAMSALAVCHVLYYPFLSLHTTLTGAPTKAQVLRSPSASENSCQISQVDFTTDTPGLNNRTLTAHTTLSSQTNLSHLFDQKAEISNDSELISEHRPGLNEPELLQQEDEKDTDKEVGESDCREAEKEGQVREREERDGREDEKASIGEEREIESRCDQLWENEVEQKDAERRGTESRKENVEEKEEDVERRVRNNHEEEDVKERDERGRECVPGVERSIQVMDGHIALGSVQWRECRAKAVQQGTNKDLPPQPAFDSACSVSSFNIQVTEEVMQRSAEALSRTGFPQRSDTQETVRRMAAMKIEHRVRLNTLKLLLERGADPNISRVPMPVLFMAIMATDVEAVRRLLLCGARTDIPLPPEKKGLYPLHVAAALPGPAGPRITELLLHAVTDPDAQACDQNSIYEPDKILMNAQKPLSTSESSHLKEGGRTALHVACQRDSDYRNASKVVALLLSHRASTDLLWSGHSPLSLAIATGNDLAVEELLKGGANPNIPLGRGVGSALCALANINYHLGGNRVKLLDMLAKAGADILMPVNIGGVVGTAVDYAYLSFNQDVRIANTPFHALNMRERETFKARRQLLSMMGDLLRQTAGQREQESLEKEKQCAASSDAPLAGCESRPLPTEKHRKPLFKFCYHCGRSVSVKLTSCSRCHKVYYCSRPCKLKAWDERHKEECVRVAGGNQSLSNHQAEPEKAKQRQCPKPAARVPRLRPTSVEVDQRSVVFKSQRGPWPTTAMLNSKAVPRPLSAKLKSPRVPMPLSVVEKVLESQINLKENYSCN